MKITHYLVITILSAVLSLAAAVPAAAQAAGSLDLTYDPDVTTLDVFAIAVQPDGFFAIIGGAFEDVGGTPQPFIARLLSWGSLNSSFDYAHPNEVSNVVLQPDGKILFSDPFGVHRLDSDGNPDGGWSVPHLTGGFNGSPRLKSMALQADGKVLIAGDFDEVNGSPRGSVARLNSDGSLDAGFNPAADEEVNSVAVLPDGKIVIGGAFTTVGGASHVGVARLNGDGTVDNEFNPNFANVRAVAVQANGKILLAGSGVTRLNSDGSSDSGFATTHTTVGQIFSVALQADGKILLGGNFRFSGDNVDRHVERLNSDGSFDPGFAADSDGVIDCVAIQADGKILLGGRFTNVNGTPRNNIARLHNDNAPQSLSAPDATKVQWMRGGAAPEIRQVTFDISTDAGASWTPLGAGTRIRGGWQLGGLSLPPNGSLRARGSTTAGIYNGGAGLIQQVEDFGPAGSVDATYVVPFTAPAVVATALQPDGKTIIGGAAQYVFRLNADGSQDRFFSYPDTDLPVYAVAVQADGKILIGGEFTEVNNTTRNGIARLHSDGTLDTLFDPNVNGVVGCLLIQPDGKVVLGGAFSTLQPNGAASATARSCIARVNSDGTLDDDFDPSASGGGVRSMALQTDGKIVLGGNFTTVGGVSRTLVARVDSAGAVDSFDPKGGPITDFPINFFHVVAIAVQADGKVLLGGNFSTMGGVTRNNLARVDSSGILDSGFDPNPDRELTSIAVQADDRILIAGGFTAVNGTTRNRIARLNANATLDSGFDPNAGDIVYSVALQADGKILLAGDFDSVGGTPRDGVARLNNDAAAQSIVANSANVFWVRSGAAPEPGQVTFERSANGSAPWTLLGSGTRVAGGWQLVGSQPTSGSVRARGRTGSGVMNGSSGLIEQVQSLDPIIVVEQPAGTSLTSGATAAFGNVALNSNTSLTFTVRNAGSGFALSGLGITIDGADASSFTVSSPPTAPVPAGGATTFTVRFAPDTAGAKNAVLHLASNDPDHTAFNINLTGIGTNTAPTVTAATGLSRRQGSAATNAVIATVADLESGAGGVGVTVTSANPSNGVTLSNIVNTAGTISADIITNCGATAGSFTLQASDGSLTTNAILNIAVTADTAPVLTYNNPPALLVNDSTTVNPATGPSDNGTVATVVIASAGTYTGTIAVSNAAVVSISNAAPAGTHTITMRATDNCGLTTDTSFTLSVNPPASTSRQLLNIATRLRVQTGENVLIGGVIVTGTEPKKVLIRAIGPSLAGAFDGALSDTKLELYDGDTLLASNENWKDTQQAEIEATTIPPNNELESAIVYTLNPGVYTAIMSGENGATGIGVIEVYDLDQAALSRLANIATRGFVQTGENVMIGGLIVGGSGADAARILIRAIGPSLLAAGVADALRDPVLELVDQDGNIVRANDNWQDEQQSEIEATTIPPSDPAEAALVVTLGTGNYTAVVRGKNGGIGVGLVEVYNVQ